MNICQTYLIAAAFVVVTDLAILMNVHRLFPPDVKELVQHGGEVAKGLNKVQVIRLALMVSIVTIIGMFAFLMMQEGCFA